MYWLRDWNGEIKSNNCYIVLFFDVVLFYFFIYYVFKKVYRLDRLGIKFLFIIVVILYEIVYVCYY